MSRLASIIDDERTIRAALRRYFARREWMVEEAPDGTAGLASGRIIPGAKVTSPQSSSRNP